MVYLDLSVKESHLIHFQPRLIRKQGLLITSTKLKSANINMSHSM